MEPQPQIDEALLDQSLEHIEKARAWSPRLVSKLEAFLRVPDEAALVRVNPIAFARERHVPEREAVDLFLHATKAGLFNMDWHLLCPSCGMAVESFGTLRSVCTHYFCELCKDHYNAQLDDFIQVSFTVAPRVRKIAYHHPESLPMDDYLLKFRFSREASFGDGTPAADGLAAMYAARTFVAPGERIELALDAVHGLISLAELRSHAGTVIAVTSEAPAPTVVDVTITPRAMTMSADSVPPGRLTLRVDNQLGQRAIFLAGLMPQELLDSGSPGARFTDFLRGSMLLTNQTFRQLFRTEVIQGAEGIGVKDVTILFTDLKGSTALYERIGDLKAFARVRQHFDRLAAVVQQHGGALIKTIGDAVMAAFPTPADAVRAATQMQDDIERFNVEHDARDVVLKIGMHCGASIAVTLNDSLDYFGQTVNIAARVQGLADADEIFITEEVFRSPGVTALLAHDRMSPQDAQLRGIQKEVRVYKAIRP